MAAVALLVLGGILGSPRDVDAHALLQSSDPAAGATLGSAPTAVTLTFGEAPDPRLSSVKVLDVGGGDHTSGPVEPVPGQPLQLRVPLGLLTNGTYTVAWRTVSSVDGHVAAGSFAFGVGEAPTVPTGATTTPTSPSASVPAVAARWLLYLGLVVLLGATFVGFAIESRPPRAVVRMAAAGWLAAAIGTVGVIAVQWSDAGADVPTLLGSSIGMGAVVRIVSLIATGIAVAVVLTRRGTIQRSLFGLAAAATAGAILVDVLAGHAAAGSFPTLDVGVQWLHAVGAGFWIGGLAALLLAVRGVPNEAKALAVRQFSRWAGVAIVLVAATGVLRAISEVQTLDALVTSDFGRLVIIKTVLLVVLAALGATNRFRNVPAAIRSLRGLRRVGSTEVAVGTVVLAVAALLVNVAPPSSAGAAPAPAQPTSLVASGKDFGTSVRLRLVVTPGTPGQNQFSASVTDYDTGSPAPATSVALRFDLASRSGVGTSTLALAATGPGTFAASGANLSIDGIWKVTATVSGPAGAVEVPLALATVIPAQPVDTVETPGAPTIETVHLDGGTSVQLYLDPGTAGKNDLHATFFDAAGAELPVATATFLVTPHDGGGTILPGRQLEPGHFIASIDEAAAELAVDLVGPDPAGNQLHAHLMMQVRP